VRFKNGKLYRVTENSYTFLDGQWHGKNDLKVIPKGDRVLLLKIYTNLIIGGRRARRHDLLWRGILVYHLVFSDGEHLTDDLKMESI